jgi:DNA-binding transcriptional MerR regulator
MCRVEAPVSRPESAGRFRLPIHQPKYLFTNPRFCLNHHILNHHTLNWIEGIDMAEKKVPRKAPTIDDLKDPLLAAVGAVDLALEELNEIIDAVRERSEEARSDASTRAEETRERLTQRREETRERLTKRREELREQLSGEELRKAYESLVERGEAAMERLRTRTRKAAPAKRVPAKKSTKK